MVDLLAFRNHVMRAMNVVRSANNAKEQNDRGNSFSPLSSSSRDDFRRPLKIAGISSSVNETGLAQYVTESRVISWNNYQQRICV